MRLMPVVSLLSAILAVGANPARARQDDPRLDALFATLKSSTASPREAVVAERRIWRIWVQNDNRSVASLMQEGILALAEDRSDAALAAFNEVIRLDAGFAEGWNKRATLEFETGDYTASVADIEHVLALEPRHFGALSGLGQIYLKLDDKPGALKAFTGALAIDPHLQGLEDVVKELRKELAGDPI